uniref:uncharacterized protein LOC122596847 n=1 Tax=Erigeron canadensis TaxID=72917 RepID=UPI001CB989D3|nr:uncharacterized protein LOC122596847 [Erigeron canadensis]
MGFHELVEKYQNNGYKKLTMGKKPAGTPKKGGTMKKVNRRFKGFRLMTSRKLKWRSFWMAMMPIRRTLSICCDMLNRLKVDGSYPAIVFTSQWGLPVLAHPAPNRSNSNVSFYRKPGNISHNVVFA